MSDFKRSITTHEYESGSDTVYALYGPGGVVTWTHVNQRDHGPVGIHSPRPKWEGHKPWDGCPFLEVACYGDAGYLGGDEVGKQWAASGHDDEVIWRELGDWYRAHLAGGGQP